MVNIIIISISITIGAIVIMFFAIKYMTGKISKLKNEIANKNIAIEKAAQNLKALTDHERLIKNIRENHNDYIKRIGKVKEDDNEEIDNILRDIVNVNNLRVSNRKNNTD